MPTLTDAPRRKPSARSQVFESALHPSARLVRSSSPASVAVRPWPSKAAVLSSTPSDGGAGLQCPSSQAGVKPFSPPRVTGDALRVCLACHGLQSGASTDPEAHRSWFLRCRRWVRSSDPSRSDTALKHLVSLTSPCGSEGSCLTQRRALYNTLPRDGADVPGAGRHSPYHRCGSPPGASRVGQLTTS